MEAYLVPSASDQPTSSDRTACPASCPFCGGSLVPLRSLLRCSRCGYTLCDDCQGGEAEG